MELPQIDTTEKRERRIKELRRELSGYGYVALPREWVRRFGSQTHISAEEAHHAGKDANYMDHVRRQIGAQLGCAIVESGATRLKDFTGDNGGRTFQLTTQILLDDPFFDAPLQWRDISR